MSSENHKVLIIDVLKNHPEGLTISSIAKMSGLHRHTSRKYINELITAGDVIQRFVGAAKLCYLNCEEKELINTEKRGFFQRFNLKLVLSVIIATFLLSEVTILAYENNAFNETLTDNLSNTSPMTSSMILNESNMSQIIENAIENASNGTVETNDSLVPVSNITTFDNSTNSSLLNETINQTIENVSIENLTNSSSNDTISSMLNGSNISQIIDNISDEIKNFSLPFQNETAIPEFNIELDYPQKITRGETFVVKVYVTNTGTITVKNVVVNLQLPEGFEFSAGSSNCDILEPTSSCISEITVMSTISSGLGPNDFKVVMNYE
jgi:uncharacterized repeat protein (TIGR01451 family)